MIIYYSKSLQERFWPKVNKYGPKVKKYVLKFYPELEGTRCWLWTGCVAGHYGRFGVRKGCVCQAHAVAYQLFYKKRLKNCGLHKCDNKLCVNPLHVFDGTHKQNSHDRDNKGRTKSMFIISEGEKNAHSRLKEKDVLYIRKHYKRGVNQHDAGNTKKLAEKFGVTMMTIVAIISRRLWSHI